MGVIGNILWFIFGGFFMGLGWWLAGLLAAITIVGIPWAKACFVIGQFAFLPFGKEAIRGLDFVSDAINRPGAVSRRIKCLTVADDFSHECVDISADFGIGGHYVTRLLDRAATFRGYPKEVRTDNGPEFTCRACMTWTQKHNIRHILIEPDSPTQNAYIESFNGTFRDECLNENWFDSLEQARQTIATWRTDYNEIRPHSSCGRVPPATFAALHRQKTCDAKESTQPDAGIS